MTVRSGRSQSGGGGVGWIGVDWGWRIWVGVGVGVTDLGLKFGLRMSMRRARVTLVAQDCGANCFLS